MLYRHIKTGTIYRWLAAGVDCTNSRDGTAVAIYCPNDDEHTIFVRGRDEFEDKFEPCCLETNVQRNPARARAEPANNTNPDGARSGLGEAKVRCFYGK